MPKKTIEAIVDGGNDYVIQVKTNQTKLVNGIEENIKNGVLLDECHKKETNKGRIENRRVRLYSHDEHYISSDWKKVNRIVEIINSGFRDGQNYFERHLYISSLTEDNAEAFAKGIRDHWCIENKLHRVKDVIQNEDNSLIEEKRIAANLSLMKSITISLFRLHGYQSIKLALERFRNRVPECGQLIGIIPI